MEMYVKAGLWQQQSLKLVMTQELTQAIALLQYSALELADFLEKKALENPLITLGTAPHRKDKKQRMNANKDRDTWIEQIPDRSFSLAKQLLSQLNLKQYTNKQLTVIRDLIEHLDESGYFTEDIDEIAAKQKVSAEYMEECLMIIQGLEPAGIGARTLQECLLIQWQRKHPVEKLGQTILSDHFMLFAERKWKLLSKILAVSLKAIQDIFDEVQTLNPKPCSYFSNEQTHYIVPDAIVERTNEGISVRLWDAAMPKMKFNDRYFHKFLKSEDRHVGQFLQEKFQDYQWLARSIEQRKETLIKVIMKIMERQDDFFKRGPQFLNPMTMKELAEEIGVHESTISRAVREKYVQTPSGTFPLKAFFSSTVQTVYSETTSSSQVKNAIAAMVEKEDKQDPLSDQEIVDLLKEKEGMVVSRRTIAKYRGQLKIPSSSKRKRY